jgi:hypothetical protein
MSTSLLAPEYLPWGLLKNGSPPSLKAYYLWLHPWAPPAPLPRSRSSTHQSTVNQTPEPGCYEPRCYECCSQSGTEKTKPLFFHLQYHPQMVSSGKQSAPLLEQEWHLIVTISRPWNLQDQVCLTRLPNITDSNPSNYIICGDNPHSPQIFPKG